MPMGTIDRLFRVLADLERTYPELGRRIWGDQFRVRPFKSANSRNNRSYSPSEISGRSLT